MTPTNDQNSVKVIFRTDKWLDEVIAFFPELPGSNAWLYDCLTYQHIGQHGSASFNYYYESTRPAGLLEYQALKAELESIGYVLRVAERMTRHDQDKREQVVKAC